MTTLRQLGRRHPHALACTLALATAAAAWLSIALRSADGKLIFDAQWLFETIGLAPTQEHLTRAVLLSIRAPRVVAAIVVGAALATSGVLLQGLTRNPLADPYLLGVSGGSGLSVVALNSVMLARDLPWWSNQCAAFVGALSALWLVLRIAGREPSGRSSIVSLVLAGFIVNAFCAALMTFLLLRFDPFKLRMTSSWLAGGIGFSSWPQLLCTSGVVLSIVVFLRSAAHRLNTFALGLEGAESLGIDTKLLLRQSSLAVGLLAAIAVALAGLLGYVGLLVPHIVRRVLGRDFRVILPAAALFGALLLTLTDMMARLVFAPEEIPVGTITALIGCPLLVYLLRKELSCRE